MPHNQAEYLFIYLFIFLTLFFFNHLGIRFAIYTSHFPFEECWGWEDLSVSWLKIWVRFSIFPFFLASWELIKRKKVVKRPGCTKWNACMLWCTFKKCWKEDLTSKIHKSLALLIMTFCERLQGLNHFSFSCNAHRMNPTTMNMLVPFERPSLIRMSYWSIVGQVSLSITFFHYDSEWSCLSNVNVQYSHDWLRQE